MKKRHLMGLGLLAAGLMAAPSAAHAQPQSMPVQGMLADASGTPVDGDTTVQFRIYTAASGGSAVHDEILTVSVADGAFTAYLGTVTILDLGIFSGGDMWLGIKVGSDAEMMPRLKLATVPYAAYAAECRSVPTGSIMFFDLASCPTGWSAFAALNGRLPLGVPSGGTLGATRGSALGNQGARTISGVAEHGHTVNQTSRGGHGHTVNPDAFSSGYQSANHTHSGTTASDTHNHDLRTEYSGDYGTYGVMGSLDYEHGDRGTGPIYNDTHNHSFSTGNNSASHRHSIDVPSTATAGDPVDHNHSVSVNSTGTGTVDVTMPYVQLLACRKD